MAGHFTVDPDTLHTDTKAEDFVTRTVKDIADAWRLLDEHQEITDIRVVWDHGQWWVLGLVGNEIKTFSVGKGLTPNGRDWYWFEEL